MNKIIEDRSRGMSKSKNVDPDELSMVIGYYAGITNMTSAETSTLLLNDPIINQITELLSKHPVEVVIDMIYNTANKGPAKFSYGNLKRIVNANEVYRTSVGNPAQRTLQTVLNNPNAMKTLKARLGVPVNRRGGTRRRRPHH
jgi:hypothetical protein